MSRRVVITGLGPVTAFGIGLDPLWDAMCAGRSAVRRITHVDPCGFECKVAAVLEDGMLDIRSIVPKSYRKATKVMCRDIELAVAAAAAAVDDAGIVTRAVDPDREPTIPPERMGCHIGAGLIAADVDELGAALWCSRGDDGAFDITDWGRQGMNNLTPLWLLKYLPNMLACHVTIVHDCQGPSNTITCCESSSGLSFGESLRVIERGAADACLSGGAESKINLMAMIRQQFAGRLARTRDDEAPESVLRPYDAQARGTVAGEGGGIIVLEAAESAAARGAATYAAVTGFASTQSQCADTVGLDVDDGGAGVADAVEIALGHAGIGPDAIDAVCPLGASIPAVDRIETAALKRVFGDRLVDVPVITTIPNAGNCVAGAGAIALSVACKALREQRLPARLNTTDCDGLDAAAAPARDAALERVLLTSTSQGGQNMAMVLERVAS